MRTKALVPALLAILIGALSLAAPATARAPASTKITIESNSIGFFGYVKSSKDKCANGRKVTLFKAKSGKDKKVGSDNAQANGDGYMWSILSESSGNFYAKAGAINGCDSGKSKTVPSEN